MDILAQATFGPDRPGALAGPFGLFLTIFLLIVVIFLIRGMKKHLGRLNARLEQEAMAAEAKPADETGPDAK
ncbi:hypothetical protein [Salininema proteolyticum]|uniref:Uncharacterized protein n=1 Tax=Salininema proteolyticum TaxID=1607685 RepID=A0ABV8TZ62_9ACTN